MAIPGYPTPCPPLFPLDLLGLIGGGKASVLREDQKWEEEHLLFCGVNTHRSSHVR